MKILKFSAENVKKLKVVEIVPDGSVVQITGPNGSGKSSVLDAIYYALTGTKGIASQPIRHGADKAVITLDLGTVMVTRRFTEGGGTSLVVESEEGARFPSPQGMLDALIGALSFDPLEFSRMKPRDQLEQLKGLVTLDVDIDQLAVQNKVDFENRTEVNRRAKALLAQADALNVPADLPDEEIDVSALLTQMQGVSKLQEEVMGRNNHEEMMVRNVERLTNKVTSLEEQIESLSTELRINRHAINEENEALALLRALPPIVVPDTTELRRQIDQANVINAGLKLLTRRAELIGQMTDAQVESDALTEAIQRRITEREAAIANATMPIAGLSFGDGEVLYNGIPFAQASSAEQLRVSIAIAMAANPKLRVLRIKDGSLLDDAGMAMLAEMADAQDFQFWVERVDTSGCVGVVMEDGARRHPEV